MSTSRSFSLDSQFNPLHDEYISVIDELDIFRPFLLHAVVKLLLVEFLLKLQFIYPIFCSAVKADECMDTFMFTSKNW